MPKIDDYVQLAAQTVREISADGETWRSFLQTASTLYKYGFYDQMMIYAQRPDATACASFELWTNTMRRYVRRGAKGIALLDMIITSLMLPIRGCAKIPVRRLYGR